MGTHGNTGIHDRYLFASIVPGTKFYLMASLACQGLMDMSALFVIRLAAVAIT